MEDGMEVNGEDRAGSPPVEKESHSREEKQDLELDRICQDVREKKLHTIKIEYGSFLRGCLKMKENVYKLADAIKSNHSFEHLHLVTTGLTMEGLEILVGATRDHPSLSRFYISESLGDEGAVILAKGLPRSLSEFTADDCDIGEHGGKELMKALRDHNLEKLSLSNNRPVGDGFIEDFECPQSLESLDLHYCGITDVGAQKLAYALAIKSAKVRFLDLSENRIGEVGAVALGGILARAPIVSLKVCDNPIGDKGARALGHALQDPDCKLTHLDAQLCDIGNDGIKAIANGLRKNSTLQLLYVDCGNDFGEKGYRALRDVVLSDNGTLQRIMEEETEENGHNALEAGSQLFFLFHLNRAGVREPLVRPEHRDLFERLSMALKTYSERDLLVGMMKGSASVDETD